MNTGSIELIDISDDDCSSMVSQPMSDIIIIQDEEFHNNQEIQRSSKRNRRTKTIDIYFTSTNKVSSKLATTLSSCDTVPIPGVVNSRNNGNLESNQISVSLGPSLLSPEKSIAYPIKKIASIVNRPSDTNDVSNVNDGVFRKENEEKLQKTNSYKKIMYEEEWECNTCSPPFHKCKQFANPLGISQTTNISKLRNVSLAKYDFRCDQCLKEFSFKSSLVRHQLSHSDPATWNKCPFCVYKTPHLTALKVHIRKHVTVRRSDRTKTEKSAIFSPKETEVKKEWGKEESKAYWDCTYCNKKFKVATGCERHELRCDKETSPLTNPRCL